MTTAGDCFLDIVLNCGRRATPAVAHLVCRSPLCNLDSFKKRRKTAHVTPTDFRAAAARCRPAGDPPPARRAERRPRAPARRHRVDHRRRARRSRPTVSHQAVYDVLRALTDAGLVRRIQPAGSVARYESRVGDNHHHVVCRSCGAIADVDCAVGHTPCLTASDDHGFAIDEAEVVYWGLCPACSTARTPQ